MKLAKYTTVILLALAAGACQTMTVRPAPASDTNVAKPCPGGRLDARAPVVCVDDSDLRDLRVHPEPIELARGSSVQWFTRTSRGNLAIVFDNAAAFEVTCTAGSGFCSAKATAGTPAGSYKYSVKIVADGQTYVLDPTVTLIEP